MIHPAKLAATALLLAATALAAQGPADRQQARKLMDDGNYREALDQLRELTLAAETDPNDAESSELASDFRRALACFQQLNRTAEIDEYRERVAARHGGNWRLLAAVAQSYLDVPHHGFRIAGAFHRGAHRGGGEMMHATARDRVRALQLFRQALALVDEDPQQQRTPEAAALASGLASALMHGGYAQAWRLQTLTSLGELPDYEEGYGHHGAAPRGAPVDDEGRPVFYEPPASWDAAQNDGQRWRWTLARRTAWQPDALRRELRERADFLRSQFSVRTMADYGWWFARPDDDADVAKSTFDLPSLGENETIARLATGIQRLTLPDEHNFLKLLRRVAGDSTQGDGDWSSALATMAEELEDRRQLPRAAELWRELLAGSPNNSAYMDRLTQITGNWGRIEPATTQRAGRGATFDYRYRNGQRVDFTARPVKVRQLLDDVKAYLSSNPRQLNWQQVNLDQLGHRLVVEGQDKYLEAESARWSLDLDPRPGHADRRVTVTTPLQRPGAYLVTASIEGGNAHRVVVWVADTAIVKKPMQGKALYYVADAVTGKPIPRCNVEFFGFSQQHIAGTNDFRVSTKNFAELTNADGLVELPAVEDNRRSWLAIATTAGAPARAGAETEPPRLAYLGFSGVWSGDYFDQEYQQVKVYTMTDRPVYRPGQQVHFKFWVATAKFDQGDASSFAAQSFAVEIHDPRGQKVYAKSLVADSFGGLGDTLQLPAGATLGQYQLMVVNHGGGAFRVEEYKKPEYEVQIDAPGDPVTLGDKVTATIRANYYFGAPVTQARVKYKVLRTTHDQPWFPPSPWDWLFGRGYAWIAEEYSWYPGWSRWGSVRPAPPWIWRPAPPPEVVIESEADLGPDGTLQVEIDTAPAKELHGASDHRYEIVADVVDASRRSIVASGEVLAARVPFRVFVWAHRGYYSTGDSIELEMAARRLDGKPVRGDGVLRLLRIAYEEGKPVESEVAKWTVAADARGRAKLQIRAGEPGQYRVSYEVTAQRADGSSGPKQEGAQLLVVRGAGFDGTGFRFNSVEIVPDKTHYAPGEKVRLQVSANRIGAAVLLFVRPSNGVYQAPQLVRLIGKSTTVELDVTARDMPNFFVEAVSVHSGRMHTAVREIFVPPTRRVFNVKVKPSAEAYLPGERAKVAIRLTDPDGKPVAGSTVVAIYDKALDYIAGPLQRPDIREFFWKWRRSHHPLSETSLARVEAPVAKPNQPQMRSIGVFGESTADQDPVRFGLAMDRGGLRLGGAMEMAASGGAPVPAAAADMMTTRMPATEDAAGGAPLVEPAIRQEFADTALWVGALETAADGTAEVELTMPENLTAWKVNVWGMGRGTRVGQGSAEVVTRKNIVVRLQAPHFFVERDEVVLSAIVHNYLDAEKSVLVRLDLQGPSLELPTTLPVDAGDGQTTEAPQMQEIGVSIPPGGETRVNWRVRVVREGQAVVRMSARTDVESDAMQMTFPVLVRGALTTASFSGAIRPGDSTGGFTLTVPEDRRPDQTRLEIRYSPTLAGAMVDALPYLADYPYGCTEQTLNRFLPAVLTQRTLQQMGVDLKSIQEKRTNLNAQELGDNADRARQWRRLDRNPVFDEATLNDMVKAGVNRLSDMQLADGGWGWFSGWGERSSAHTTAVVVRGLALARANDVAIVPGVIERGIEWLRRYQAEQLAALDNWDREAAKSRDPDSRSKPTADNLDALVYLVLAESQRSASGDFPTEAELPADAGRRMRDYLYGDRTKLAPYSLATFALALHLELPGDAKPDDPRRDMLAMLLRNLSQYLQQDDENQTAWLDLPGGQWWHWYGSEFEAQAYYLKLLAAIEPDSPVAPRLVKYLLNNRKHAGVWNSTRDTALVVEALAAFLAASGEARPNMSLEILVDGELAKTVEITPETLFSFDNSLVLVGDQLAAGDHVVELRKTGDGPVYFNGYLTNFSLQDPIPAAGLELKVARRYYKLTPAADRDVLVPGSRGQALSQRGQKYDRTPVADLATLTSGDLVEVELIVDSKNDYEYIVLEDSKPAGFEPLEVRSGYSGNALGAYVEYRDDRVALFCTRIARSTHSIAYRVRAEIPGRFSALPAQASAMYAPELRANSESAAVQIVD